VSALAASAGLLVALGVALAVSGLVRTAPPPRTVSQRALRRADLVGPKVLAAGAAGLAVLVVTRWPVAAAGAAVAAWLVMARRARTSPAG